MNTKRIALTIVVIAGIVGAIIYLESSKAGPARTADSVDEIRIEEELALQDGEDVTPMDSADAQNDVMVATEDVPGTVDTAELSITPTRAQVIEQKAQEYPRAKEITSPDAFINVDQINIRDLIGEKIILVDFWTYSCVNCQRTTPYLNSWYEKYEDDGLVIIGIHTPEFEFEKEYSNVSKASAALGIEYPVVMDNDYSTWSAYNNRYWPRKYLIDIDGFIVYDHIGEGAYEQTEAKIVEALNERNRVLGVSKVVTVDGDDPEDVDEVDFSKIGTPETYLGSWRMQYLANPRGNCDNTMCEYEAPESIPNNLFAFDGLWRIEEKESVLDGEDGSLYSNFYANKLNLVAGSDEPVQAEIYLDGARISDAQAGSDVTNGMVTFHEHTLYNLVDLQGEYGRHTLEIRFLDGEVSVFAFTFG